MQSTVDRLTNKIQQWLRSIILASYWCGKKQEFTARKFFLLTKKEKFSRDFKHRDQINDSSGSIMDNIAEGFGRGGRNEFVNFLSIAMGSCTETQSQAYRAFDREYITDKELNEILSDGREIEKMTTGLIISLNKSEVSGLKFKDRNRKL